MSKKNKRIPNAQQALENFIAGKEINPRAWPEVRPGEKMPPEYYQAVAAAEERARQEAEERQAELRQDINESDKAA